MTGRLTTRSTLRIHSVTETSFRYVPGTLTFTQSWSSKKRGSAPALRAAARIPVRSMLFAVEPRIRADMSPTYTFFAPSSYSTRTTAATTEGFVVVGFPFAPTTFGFTSTLFPRRASGPNPPISETAFLTISARSFPPTAATSDLRPRTKGFPDIPGPELPGASSAAACRFVPPRKRPAAEAPAASRCRKTLLPNSMVHPCIALDAPRRGAMPCGNPFAAAISKSSDPGPAELHLMGMRRGTRVPPGHYGGFPP